MLSGYVVGPDRVAELVLVVLTQNEPDDQDRRVDVEIRPPNGGQPLRIAYEVPEAAMLAEIGFAFFPVRVRLAVDGRWVIVVTGGAGMISLPLAVSG